MIEDMQIEVVIIRQQRNTVQISITPDGKVQVKAPKTLADEQIWEFVRKKRVWISNKLNQKHGQITKLQEIESFEHITLLGEKINILLAGVQKPELVNNVLLLPQKLIKNEADKQKLIAAYLTKKAKEILPQIIAQIAAKLSVCPTEIKIKHSTAKWGSCDANGIIMLNCKLIMLPYELIEYVALHELSHLYELNHSTKFWKIVETFLPSYKDSRRQLKEYTLLLR